MYITHVNDKKLSTPQVIYGMPSIVWPSLFPKQTNTNDTGCSFRDLFQLFFARIRSVVQKPLRFPEEGDDPTMNPFTSLPIGSRCYLANKWNGFNLAVFKYVDVKGASWLSVRPRTFPFVKDISTFSNTLTVTREILKISGTFASEIVDYFTVVY
jgi:hypothetical protein